MKPHERPSIPSDTTPEAWRKFIEAHSKLTPGERVTMAFEWTASLLRMAEESVRRRHPRAGEREVFLRAAALRLGNQTVERVYGWNPGTDEPPPDGS